MYGVDRSHERQRARLRAHGVGMQGAILATALLLLTEISHKGVLAKTPPPMTRLRFQIEASSADCFFEDIPPKSKVSSRLVILRGSPSDVWYRISNPDNDLIFDRVIQSDINDETGEKLDTVIKKGHDFETSQGGNYAFCFDNKRSSWNAKLIEFELEIKNADTKAEHESVENADEGDKTLSVVYGLSDWIKKLEREQRFLASREKRHRETLESNNARVQWYSLVETVVIVGASLAQLLIVRYWFKTGETILPGKAY
eukprot:gb/GECG01007626.1/.p1 GENE.gb/GECG01007626.1/~~gb/GECG01007626.1/.p1  ORF type:complete len:257 (+),score=20.96 gb/GECG01007626.1/:1-771(+)